MFKITFEYFNRFDDRCEVTLQGSTKEEAYAKAYDWSLKNGDGEYSVVSLREMVKANVA